MLADPFGSSTAQPPDLNAAISSLISLFDCRLAVMTRHHTGQATCPEDFHPVDERVTHAPNASARRPTVHHSFSAKAHSTWSDVSPTRSAPLPARRQPRGPAPVERARTDRGSWWLG